MLLRGLIDRVSDLCMIVMHGNVQHQNSINFETDVLYILLFLISYTAFLWCTINKLIFSSKTCDNLSSKIELSEYGR